MKDDELNGLVAYYSRFLFFFGFSETLNWLGSLHSKWSKQITDFKLVKLKKYIYLIKIVTISM